MSRQEYELMAYWRNSRRVRNPVIYAWYRLEAQSLLEALAKNAENPKLRVAAYNGVFGYHPTSTEVVQFPSKAH